MAPRRFLFRAAGAAAGPVSSRPVDAPARGHIHGAAAGANGPVVAGLFAGTIPQPISAATGCTAADDRQPVRKINADPSNYYLNLHNAGFAAGATRGQLFR
jgi:hypothetical protein